MKKSRISFYFIFISFLTLLTIFFSIVQKSYFSFITPQKLIENDTLLSDFDSNLDLTIISTIESKNKNIDESFDFSIIESNQKLNKVITTPIATPSGQNPSNSNQTLKEITLTPTAALITTP